jgi:hypothetical protein
VFLHLKIFLGGQRFHDDEVNEAVNTWFASQAASFYDAGIQKLMPLYNKCPNNGGNYVAKYCKVCTSNDNINGLEIIFFFNSPSELTFWITYVQILVRNFRNIRSKSSYSSPVTMTLNRSFRLFCVHHMSLLGGTLLRFDYIKSRYRCKYMALRGQKKKICPSA